jgi:hypothetical protein
MKTGQTREVSLLKRAVVVSFLLVLSVIGATAYNVLGGPEIFQTRSYSMSQLSADARTVAAALSYLLEAEPPDVGTGAAAQRSVG